MSPLGLFVPCFLALCVAAFIRARCVVTPAALREWGEDKL